MRRLGLGVGPALARWPAQPLRPRCRIKMFVLDEADEMLSRGFKDQIYDIFQLLPPKLQVSRNICCAAASWISCATWELMGVS